MNGKNTIVPTLSNTSVSTCAADPMMIPRNQARLRPRTRIMVAKRIPNISECVNPTPGHPRWYFHGSCCGWMCRTPKEKP